MVKTVLITGTSSGIGLATAIHFAQQGWNVAATMRNPAKAKGLESFSNVKIYSLDVTDRQSVANAVETIMRDLGSIDVLVNNAGFGTDGVFEAMSDEVIAEQFNTNVFGLMRMTRAIIPYFRAQSSGRIIQIASMGGRITFPLYSIYHSSKWAVEGFSESLQYELAPFGIQVKIVEPGAIKTEFYTEGRKSIPGAELPMYSDFVAKVDRVSQGSGNNGESPATVAKTVFMAATDRRNKLRYPVGKPAPLLLRLRKMLPDGWYFALIKSSYKI
jgi:NAD(P)-dependent dehydrogenase (short-subunit alcohol dehydrogenase family)